jgi:hypothetical protein
MKTYDGVDVQESKFKSPYGQEFSLLQVVQTGSVATQPLIQ